MISIVINNDNTQQQSVMLKRYKYAVASLLLVDTLDLTQANAFFKNLLSFALFNKYPGNNLIRFKHKVHSLSVRRFNN